MSEKYKAVGKTVDEAIFKGLNELEISIDEVDVEIVQNESKGVFGIGSKPAIVMLTRRSEARHFEPEPVRQPARRDRPSPRDNNRSANRPIDRQRSSNQPRRSPEPARAAAPADTDAAASPSPSDNRQQRAPRENIAPSVAPFPYTEEAAKDCASAQFLGELLEKMGIQGKVLAYVNENEERLNVETADTGVLIGYKGETLNAVQYITSLVINKGATGERYTKISVDVDGYRQRRYEKLVSMARSKASLVRSSGRDYKFEPMTAFERSVIHSTLQTHPYVTTHSEGTEPYRCVVLSSKRRQRGENRYN